MPVHRRSLSGGVLAGFPIVGAVRTAGRTVAGFAGEVDRADLVSALTPQVSLIGAPGIVLADIGRADAPPCAVEAEPELTRGRNALLAFHSGETPEAVRDWLCWHRRFCNADAAVIHFGPGGPLTEVAEAVATVSRDMDIVLVEGDVRLGTASFALFELVRRAFLAEAVAVLWLTLADLVIEDRQGTPFDRAAGLAAAALPLAGSEVFPWRLRQGKPAYHGDHVARRLREAKRLSAWCVAPRQCPAGAVWRPNRIAGMPLAEDRPGRFIRAMGVARPGVTVGRLARKADLIEDADLVRTMTGAFRRRPPVAQAGKRRRKRERAEGRSVTLVTMMKNEGPFILDWLAHHRVVGVERFLVYTNDCGDGTERLLDLLSDAGVERRDNPYRATGGVPQHAARNSAGVARSMQRVTYRSDICALADSRS